MAANQREHAGAPDASAIEEALRYEDLAVSSNRSLEEIFRSAPAPAPETLTGYEWRGYNISAIAKLLGIQKFIKGFWLLNGVVEGYNVAVEQNGLRAAWVHRPSAENPKRYAFFVVARVDTASQDNVYPSALLLNYGASQRNPRFAVERLLRDYVVQPDRHNPSLLLAKAYLALGRWRPFVNFFVIERLRPTDWTP